MGVEIGPFVRGVKALHLEETAASIPLIRLRV
jgi:hypothetical protein